MRSFSAAVALLLVIGCDSRIEALGYETSGTGQISTCRGLGITLCTDEATAVPRSIDALDPDWAGIYFEGRGAGAMCFRNLSESPISESYLSFSCNPLPHRVATSDRAYTERLKKAILKNLGVLSEAAAGFEVCASDDRLSDSESLDWTQCSIDLSEIAERLSEHFADENLLLSFELARTSIEENPEFRAETVELTNNCSSAGLPEAKAYVAEARRTVEYYLAFPRDALHPSNMAEGKPR